MGELILVGDRVLIDPADGEQKTQSGLVLPATVTEKDRFAVAAWCGWARAT